MTAFGEIGNHKYLNPIGYYALGYLDAAVALFNRANDGRGMVDFAIYPAGYCLRHGLELLMKQMSIYVAYERHDPSLLYKLGHEIGEPWAAFKELARDAHRGWWDPGEGMEDHFDVIDEVIDNLSDLDKRGVLFRYPENVWGKNDKRTRTGQELPMNIVHFGDWSATAGAVFFAAQMILSTADGATAVLANHRGDQFANLHDFVIVMAQPQPPSS